MTKSDYLVRGMHCSACANVISRKINKLPGIVSCDVSYVTQKAKIEFEKELDIKKINKILFPLGYELKEVGESTKYLDADIKELKNKVIVLFPLAIFFFMIMMISLIIKIDDLIVNLLGFIGASIVLTLTGKKYLRAIWSFFTSGNGNMDSLIGLGIFVAYIYSCLIWFFPEVRRVLSTEHAFFDVVIVVVGFVFLGKYLETVSKKKTTQAVESLISLQAKLAWVKRGKEFVQVSVEDVVVGDLVMLKPGDVVPVDGVVHDGSSYIDESSITGESIPVDKKIGDRVLAATINKNGSLIYKSTKVGRETMMGKIIELVAKAQESKAKIQTVADKISGFFVPIVILVSVITFIYWWYVGMLDMAIMSAVGVLVISCPCALGLATPLGIVVGVGKGAKNGILFKNAESLEKLEKISTIVFDKTGTLTKGKPVVKIYDLKSLQYAYSLEYKSNHPLGVAIVDMSNSLGLKRFEVTSFKEIEGVGLEGVYKGKKLEVRKPNEIEKKLESVKKIENELMSVVVVVYGGKYLGVIGISDDVKDGVGETIQKIKKLGIRAVMLSGDRKNIADHVGKEIGMDEIFSEVLPNEKYEVIKKIKSENGGVVMVGDGINDAPALAVSDVSIAMGTGTDVAINSSDITLLGGDINKVYEALVISKQTMRVVRQNLFWAFIYNLIGIPLAAGAFVNSFGLMLNPVFAGMAMALSSFSVVINSLRLRYIKI